MLQSEAHSVTSKFMMRGCRIYCRCRSQDKADEIFARIRSAMPLRKQGVVGRDRRIVEDRAARSERNKLSISREIIPFFIPFHPCFPPPRIKRTSLFSLAHNLLQSPAKNLLELRLCFVREVRDMLDEPSQPSLGRCRSRRSSSLGRRRRDIGSVPQCDVSSPQALLELQTLE